jgi:hypothetical protein
LVDPSHGVPRDVYEAYHKLADFSRDDRYTLATFSVRKVRDLLDHELAAIATFVGM